MYVDCLTYVAGNLAVGGADDVHALCVYVYVDCLIL
jgi:hypothetical protein